MEVRKTSIEGLVEIFPTIFEDARGHFLETYNQPEFSKLGLPSHFVQDNQSFSKKGVIRALHLQADPYAQGKLVRALTGKILDVAVDLRTNSPTFGKWESFVLDPQKSNLVYVPEGFGHGFAALEDSHFAYKCTKPYHKESEIGIRWDDSDLNIDWQVANPIVSDRDKVLPSFRGVFPR